MANPAHSAHDDHGVPARTLPQGTQAYGTIGLHEQRDILFAPIGKWFLGLAIFTVLVLVGMAFVFRQMLADADRADEAAEAARPILMTQQQHPEPRMLPNPVDDNDPHKPLVGPGEYLLEVREEEEKKLFDAGLWERDEKLPRLQQGAVAQVLSRVNGTPAVTGSGSEERMPSDSSGGLATEDRLR